MRLSWKLGLEVRLRDDGYVDIAHVEEVEKFVSFVPGGTFIVSSEFVLVYKVLDRFANCVDLISLGTAGVVLIFQPGRVEGRWVVLGR